MDTVKIEILRSGMDYNYNLSPDQKYIVLCGSHPKVELFFNCDQRTFNKNIKLLRYSNSEVDRLQGIDFFQKLLIDPLNQIEALKIEGNKSQDELHIRLITSSKELIQIPFELALTPSGFEGELLYEFLLNPKKQTTFTREVRQVDSEHYSWPIFPRVLFIWAEPGEKVPRNEHTSAFVKILTEISNPLNDSLEGVPDLAPLITILGKASLNSIKSTIEKSIAEGKPYTHVHILTHGVKVDDGDLEFKMLLHDNQNMEKAYHASGNELVNSLIGIKEIHKIRPAVVSLMVCDSANEGSPVISSGSIAFELHEGGIPCVFASQFPLTVNGSVHLVETLYDELLLHGRDPRKALINIRFQLKEHHHDWASLVALARFPEDIEFQLQDTRLKLFFRTMKIANNWAEYLIKNENSIKPEKVIGLYENVKSKLEKSIKRLEVYIKNGNSTLSSNSLKAEHLGLLGSAYKRKAEFLFVLSKNQNQEIPIKESVKLLEIAEDYYGLGFKAERSNHWNAMQNLVLKAIRTGTLKDEAGIWNVIEFMSKDEIENNSAIEINRLWGLGTMVELQLLKPLTVKEIDFSLACKESLDHSSKYFKMIQSSNNEAVIDSTTRQLKRYINWWPLLFPEKFPKILSEMAQKLIAEKRT